MVSLRETEDIRDWVGELGALSGLKPKREILRMSQHLRNLYLVSRIPWAFYISMDQEHFC